MDMLVKPLEDVCSPSWLMGFFFTLMVELCGDVTAGEDAEVHWWLSSVVYLFWVLLYRQSGFGMIVELCGSSMWVNQSDTCHGFSHLPHCKVALFLLLCFYLGLQVCCI